MTFCTGVKFSKSSDFGEIGLKLISLTYAFRKCIDSYTYKARTRVIKGSKVIPYVVSMGVDLWPIHWPISGHCTYGKLYLFWINIAVQLLWAHFQWDRIILKIWPLYKRSLTFFPFIPLSWQRNIVWISCNWLFYSLWREEEFEICFNLIGAFLSFIPILPLTLDFMVKMLFEKMPGMFVW